MFRFIWRYSRRDQLLILALVLLSLPLYFLSLDLPKTIVNKAIQGHGFEENQTLTTFDLILPALPYLWDDEIVLLSGLQLERIPFLVSMSLLFLALVILNGLFKFQINTAKGRLGERMLRRLRFMLFERILRFPPEHFRHVKAPELATIIKDEVEPLGGFIGDAYVHPVFLGGQIATALTFIFIQNIWLGVVAGVIALLQALIVPRLRAPLLALGRERQLTARALAGRIGEAVDSVTDIRTNGTEAYEKAAIGQFLGRIFSIRFRLYQKKFLVKFINNLLAQLTPFFFFLVGGYFAIKEQLDVGQLVAVIVAYKELPGPMKEIIDWDLRRLDGKIKYEQVVSQFTLATHESGDKHNGELQSGIFKISDLTVYDDDVVLLDNLTLSFDTSESTLLDGSGASPLIETIAGLRTLKSGSIVLGDHKASMAALSRHVSYVGEVVHLSGETVFEALAYGLYQKPVDLTADEQVEAHRTGNSVYLATADWIDYERAGVKSRDGLCEAMLNILQVVGLEQDLYRWGLRQPIDHSIDTSELMAARRAVEVLIINTDHAELIERFDETRYTQNATIGENIVFGVSSIAPDSTAIDPNLLSVLRQTGLETTLIGVGRNIAVAMVEIFSGLSSDNPLIEQFSFVSGEELPELDALLKQKKINKANEQRFLVLALRYCEAKHRLGLLTSELEDDVMRARSLFRSILPDSDAHNVSFYSSEKPTIGACLIDDIIFGKIVDSKADAVERIHLLVYDVLREKGLQHVVLHSGLSYPIGSAGRRLSTIERQCMGIARALLRRPEWLLINRALVPLGPERERVLISQIVKHLNGKGLLAALGSAPGNMLFDRHIVLDQGIVSSDTLRIGEGNTAQ